MPPASRRGGSATRTGTPAGGRRAPARNGSGDRPASAQDRLAATGASALGAARRRPQAEPAGRGAADLRDEGGALAEAAETLGVALSDSQRDKLLAYCALLRRWNAVYNLTAISDPAAMLVQHVFDCLAIVPALREAPGAATACAAATPQTATPQTATPQTATPQAATPQTAAPRHDLLHDGAVVLDVGSGGGLPGVVLAICAPGAQVYCVDAVGKKAAFVTQVRADLGLANLHALHARVEDLAAPRDLPAASLIVSRAFSSLAQFVALTRHLLAPGGQWAAMKGHLPADEVEALPEPVRLCATITLAVPRLDAQRHLLLMAG